MKRIITLIMICIFAMSVMSFAADTVKKADKAATKSVTAKSATSHKAVKAKDAAACCCKDACKCANCTCINDSCCAMKGVHSKNCSCCTGKSAMKHKAAKEKAAACDTTTKGVCPMKSDTAK